MKKKCWSSWLLDTNKRNAWRIDQMFNGVSNISYFFLFGEKEAINITVCLSLSGKKIEKNEKNENVKKTENQIEPNGKNYFRFLLNHHHHHNWSNLFASGGGGWSCFNFMICFPISAKIFFGHPEVHGLGFVVNVHRTILYGFCQIVLFYHKQQSFGSRIKSRIE